MSLLRDLMLPFLASGALFAATLSPAPSGTSLVIYNSGIGLVHEQRSFSVDKGEQSVIYPGVATTVQTDSVSVQLPEGLILYSQQYRYDRITLAKILEAHIGKKVRFKKDGGSKNALGEGVLLASNPPVVKTGRGIESGISAEDFIFDAIPETLMIKPSLVWNIEAKEKTQGEMTLDYLISDIRWKSDYILNLHGQSGDLGGWITVDNRSGKRFEKIDLHLLAGDINRVVMPARYADVMVMEKQMAAAPVTQQAHEGYHLYSVPFRVTIADNEKTQIKFLDRPNHALKRLYEVTMQPPFGTSVEQKRPVSQSVELSEFDVPLPGGIVRTYSETGGTTVLLGETPLQNTPKDEKVKLRLGTNFDLVAKNRLISRSDDKNYLGATVAYSLTNRSDAPKTVEVIVPGIVESTSHQTTVTTVRPYTRPDGYSLQFSVTVGAGETQTWDVAYRARKE